MQLREQFKLHDSTCGSGGVGPLIFNVSTRCTLVVRVTSRRYPSNSGPGGPSRSERSGVEKNLLPLPGIELRLLGHPASSLVTILTELSRYFSGWLQQTITTLLSSSLFWDVARRFGTTYLPHYQGSSSPENFALLGCYVVYIGS